ncbi:hypothetical protein JOM56_011514 [Amanita muscaria]
MARAGENSEKKKKKKKKQLSTPVKDDRELDSELLKQLAADVTLLKKENDGIKEDNNRIKEDNNRIKEDNNRIKTKLMKAETDITELKDENDGIKEDNNRIKEDNNRIKTKLMKAETDVTELKDKLTVTEQRLAKAETEVEEIQKTLSPIHLQVLLEKAMKKLLTNMGVESVDQIPSPTVDRIFQYLTTEYSDTPTRNSIRLLLSPNAIRHTRNIQAHEASQVQIKRALSVSKSDSNIVALQFWFKYLYSN